MNDDSDPSNGPKRITTALLLAAGMGSRLLPLTKASPKCMTLVNERSILERFVTCLKEQNFKRLVIVTGHYQKSIIDFLGTISGDMTIEYIHSPLYKTTNNIYSLWMAQEIIQEPFTLFESDLIFDKSLLDDMVIPDRIAVAGIQPWMNGTTVSLDSGFNINEFKNNVIPYLQETRYKTVNIYSFSYASWCAIVERLNQYISAGKVNCYYEIVFAELVEESSLSLKAVSFDHKPWYEIDTLEDLAEAVKLFPVSKYSTNKVALGAN